MSEPRHNTEPLGVMCVRVSAGDRALVAAVAAITRATLSSVVRDLMREGARDRLRELAARQERT